MNSDQIKYFISLVECQNFSETAEKMYISQPTLSRYIRTLEAELGLQLIDRSHRKIRLTEEGSIIYEYFKDAVNTFNEALFRAHNKEKEQKMLSVVILEGLDTDIVLKPLLDYQFYARDVNISFEQLPAYQIPTFLLNGKYNLAVTMEDQIHPAIQLKKNIKYETILTGSLNLFYSIYHSVNQLDRQPDLEDFKDDIFYFPVSYSNALMKDNSKATSLELYTEGLGYTPKMTFVDSVTSIMPNLLNGSGVSILGEHCRMQSSPYFKSIGMSIRSDIVYAWCEEYETDLLRDVMKFNQEHFVDNFIF